ncbi:hypothetical protein C5167_016547 [Papaver somniferum]|nr:hypothetical protein C5167_016547 [Papaver somniferum]
MAMEIPRSQFTTTVPRDDIYRAIRALNEVTGSNKSSISNYVESTYGDLPAEHTKQLTQDYVCQN